ncbi:MAG TPA: hypothetical protein VD993_15485 [Chitinophagaceae bacterium]|nr:hypothetical protein [Chitinophagaceae bacterium]
MKSVSLAASFILLLAGLLPAQHTTAQPRDSLVRITLQMRPQPGLTGPDQIRQLVLDGYRQLYLSQAAGVTSNLSEFYYEKKDAAVGAPAKQVLDSGSMARYIRWINYVSSKPGPVVFKDMLDSLARADIYQLPQDPSSQSTASQDNTNVLWIILAVVAGAILMIAAQLSVKWWKGRRRAKAAAASEQNIPQEVDEWAQYETLTTHEQKLVERLQGMGEAKAAFLEKLNRYVADKWTKEQYEKLNARFEELDRKKSELEQHLSATKTQKGTLETTKVDNEKVISKLTADNGKLAFENEGLKKQQAELTEIKQINERIRQRLLDRNKPDNCTDPNVFYHAFILLSEFSQYIIGFKTDNAVPNLNNWLKDEQPEFPDAGNTITSGNEGFMILLKKLKASGISQPAMGGKHLHLQAKRISNETFKEHSYLK